MHKNMRLYHRYLGFFLAGIMTIYALSGIVLIFRDTDFLKNEVLVSKTLPIDTQVDKLGDALRIRGLKVTKTDEGIVYFEQGTYNTKTGEANYSVKELPYVMNKMTHLHKATSSQPLFFLNVFFGLALLFFVLSSFWMYLPDTTIFKKGIYFAIGGIIFAALMLFL